MNSHTEFAVDTTNEIIRCAIKVHRHLGPGLLESVYESALCLEVTSIGLRFTRQTGVPVLYKGEVIAEHRPDLVVNDEVVVEVKSVADLLANNGLGGRVDPELQPTRDEGWYSSSQPS